MIEIFNKFNETVLYRDGDSLQSKIKELKLKLNNDSGKDNDKIRSEIRKYEYGLKGEKKIIYELMNSHIPMYILHDLTIEYKDYKAQIDFIIITKKNCFIVECKHLYGNLFINNKGDFYRVYKNEMSAIYNPITQLDRHINLIKRYIKDKNGLLGKFIVSRTFDNYYHGIVVLSNENMVVNDRMAPVDVKRRVIRADKIIDYIKKVERESKNISNNEKEVLEFANRLISLESKVFDNNVNLEVEVEKKVSGGDVKDKKVLVSDEIMRERLRQYRVRKAIELNYKPYFIFNDRTLNELVRNRPTNIEELRKIEGIADKKISQYGNDILRIINDDGINKSY